MTTARLPLEPAPVLFRDSGPDATAGGQGAGALTPGLAIEVAAAADFNAAYLVLLAALCAEIIAAAGPGAEHAAWLRDIATGQVTVCLALTEPDHGSDAAAIEVQAARRGDDYVLRGEKTSVSLGAVAERRALPPAEHRRRILAPQDANEWTLEPRASGADLSHRHVPAPHW